MLEIDKIIRILCIALIATTYSCTKEPNNIETHKLSEACFETTKTTYKVGDTLTFTNCSKNAIHYTWSFDDGSISNQEEPNHSYAKNGSYRITLIAENEFSVDTIIKPIEVIDNYSNYIQVNNIQYELSKAKILSGKFRNNYQTKILLGSNNAIFENDSVISDDLALCLVKNSLPNSQQYKLGAESYSLNQSIELTEAELEIIMNENNITLNINDAKFTLNFQSSYSLGKLTNYPSFAQLENYISKRFEAYTSHTFAQYEELLAELATDKYIAVSVAEMIDTYDKTKVIVGLRHDVDNNHIAAMKMADLENKHGVRATYYILATSPYYGYFEDGQLFRYQCMERAYLHIHKLGNEIGIHNDLIAVMIQHKIDPFEFNMNELNFYKSLGIPIIGSVGHGSNIASRTAHNSQIFSDYAKSDFVEYGGEQYPIGEHTMAEYGFEYEANFIDMNMYFSDSGGSWNNDKSFEQVLQAIKDSKPGDRIQILVHPCWWGN